MKYWRAHIDAYVVVLSVGLFSKELLAGVEIVSAWNIGVLPQTHSAIADSKVFDDQNVLKERLSPTEAQIFQVHSSRGKAKAIPLEKIALLEKGWRRSNPRLTLSRNYDVREVE